MPYQAAEVRLFLSRRLSGEAAATRRHRQSEVPESKGAPLSPPTSRDLTPLPGSSRGQQVVDAFVAVYRRLEPHLGDGWIGAFARLAGEAPALSSGVSAAEETANSAGIAYVKGVGCWSEFRWALHLFEAALAAAAGFLSDPAVATTSGPSECPSIKAGLPRRSETEEASSFPGGSR